MQFGRLVIQEELVIREEIDEVFIAGVSQDCAGGSLDFSFFDVAHLTRQIHGL